MFNVRVVETQIDDEAVAVQHIVAVYFSVSSKISIQGQYDNGTKQGQLLSRTEQFVPLPPQTAGWSSGWQFYLRSMERFL